MPNSDGKKNTSTFAGPMTGPPMTNDYWQMTQETQSGPKASSMPRQTELSMANFNFFKKGASSPSIGHLRLRRVIGHQ
jgi:hypothetical protein